MKVILLFFTLGLTTHLTSQSFWFGAKTGAAMNLQSWGSGGSGLSFNRSPLFSINGDIIVDILLPRVLHGCVGPLGQCTLAHHPHTLIK